jgi:hypothetical protein
MISTKKVLDSLVAKGLASSWQMKKYDDHSSPAVQSDKLFISNETYGKRSFLYFYCQTPEIAKELCQALREAGGEPGLNWNGGIPKGCVELQVSYFKGWHHWE